MFDKLGMVNEVEMAVGDFSKNTPGHQVYIFLTWF